MGQWGKAIKYKEITFLPHFDTGEVFNPISNTSIIDTVIVSNIENTPSFNIEEVKNFLIGKTYEEFLKLLSLELKLPVDI